MKRIAVKVAILVLFVTLSADAATAQPTPCCVGDCDGDGEVMINEIVAIIGITLGSGTLDSFCLEISVGRCFQG